jgi:signal transduction histidine kinase
VVGSHSGDGGLFEVGRRWSLDGTNVLETVRRTHRPARIDDYTGLPGQIAEASRAAGIHSAVGIPIVVSWQLWGAIVILASDAEPLPDGTESRLLAFSELIAMAISNAHARSEVERLAQEQAALRRVATVVARESPAAEVFAGVAEEVGRLLGVAGAVIRRREPDGADTVVGSWGRSAAEAGSDARRLDAPIVVDGRVWGALGIVASGSEPMPVDAESRIAEFTELVATGISKLQARAELAASRARIAATADEERRRVVRDLHDGAQQRLVHTIVTLKLARRALEREAGDPADLVEEALKHAHTAIRELRELAHGILPDVLTHGGLNAGLRALVSRTPIPVEVDVAVDRLERAVEATAYFIVAEALTNVAKHSRARRATVSARVAGHALLVEVRDDGLGGARADGPGLVGLADRVAALEGSLRVESPAGGGTLIAASLPVAPR